MKTHLLKKCVQCSSRKWQTIYIKFVLATFGFQIWRHPQVIPSLGWSKISRETWLLACGRLSCYQAISRDERPYDLSNWVPTQQTVAENGPRAQQNGDAGAEKTCHTHKKAANWARPFAAGLSNLNLIQNQNLIDLTKPRTQETVLFQDFPMPSLNLVKQVLNCVKQLAKGSKQLDHAWSILIRLKAQNLARPWIRFK